MVSLLVEKGVLEENCCNFFIKDDNVLLFMDMEEVFRGLNKVEDEDLRKFCTDNLEEIGINSRGHCDALEIVRDAKGELIIKIIELTAMQGRDLHTLLNKMNFCIAFINTLVRRSLYLSANNVRYVTVFVVNPNDVDKVKEFIERNMDIITNTYRWLYYFTDMLVPEVIPCGKTAQLN